MALIMNVPVLTEEITPYYVSGVTSGTQDCGYLQSGVQKAITGSTSLHVTVVLNKKAQTLSVTTAHSQIYIVREVNGNFTIELVDATGTISNADNVMFVYCQNESNLTVTATF